MNHSLLNIALVQFDIVWNSVERNIEILKELLTVEDLDGVDLVIFPETWSTGFMMQEIDQIESFSYRSLMFMIDSAVLYKLAISGSVFFKDGDEVYNRFFFVYPDGSYKYYDKRHLFRFSNEHKFFSSGTERLIIEYKGFRIFPQICYDLRFPVWSRNDCNYDLLLYVANWPLKRIQHWDILLSARAIENLSFVVGVNRIGSDKNGNHYPGHSSIYDFGGSCLLFTKEFGLFKFCLDKNDLTNFRGQHNFLPDQDMFILKR